MTVTIKVLANGPLVVEGPVSILDAKGNTFPVRADKPAVALCRCGHAATRPFCDGAHKTGGFQADEAAPVE